MVVELFFFDFLLIVEKLVKDLIKINLVLRIITINGVLK